MRVGEGLGGGLCVVCVLFRVHDSGYVGILLLAVRIKGGLFGCYTLSILFLIYHISVLLECDACNSSLDDDGLARWLERRSATLRQCFCAACSRPARVCQCAGRGGWDVGLVLHPVPSYSTAPRANIHVTVLSMFHRRDLAETVPDHLAPRRSTDTVVKGLHRV